MTSDKLAPKIRFKGFSDPWEQRKLGEIFRERKDRSANGELLSVTINTGIVKFNSLERKNNSSADKSNYKIVKKNDIAYNSMRMWQGASGVSDYDGIVSPAYTVIIPNVDMVSRFFGYQFKQIKMLQVFQRNSQGLTSDTWNLKFPALKNIKVTIPEKDEQTCIVDLLNLLDSHIAANEDKLDQLKQLKKLLMQKIFSQKWRFKGFTDPWEQRTLNKFGSFYYGKSAPKWSVSDTALTPCIRYGELYTKFDEKINKIYSYTNIDPSNLKFSNGSEVLVPRVGEDPLDFANCSWLSIPNVAIGEMISVYNTDENPLFIAYYFNSQLRYEFAQRVEGGNVSNLYFDRLKDISISIPIQDEQEKIATILSVLTNLIAANEEKLEQLKQLKKYLMQNMFV